MVKLDVPHMDKKELLPPKGEIITKSVKSDAVAGLTVSIVNIAEGLAYSILAGVQPIYGLYSGVVPPIMAGLFASSAFMVVTLTSEMALMTASLFETMGTIAMSTVFMFTILIGLWQLIFGYFKLGRYLRFVSSSVMTGFVTGLAVLVILGQIPELLGATSEYSNKILAAVDVLINPSSWNLPTVFIGILMIVMIIAFMKTRFSKITLIISMILASVANLLLGLIFAGFSHVELIGDIAQVPRSLPLPAIPNFLAIPDLLLPSLTTAILGVAVSVAVSQNYTNPNGDYSDSNKDFVGLGAANTLGGIFQSTPSTGSLSRTATIVSAGAKSRMALILSGLLMAALLATIAPLAEYIPMAALAGLLIVVSFESINQQRILRAWKTHLIGQISMIITFILTLTTDLISALLFGIIISLGLHLYQSSLDVRVRRLKEVGEVQFKEEKPPKKFPSNQVTAIKNYGSTHFASVDTLEKKMPSVEGVKNAVIIFVERGRTEANNTYLSWMRRFVNKLHRDGNELFIAEAEPSLKAQLKRTDLLDLIGAENVFLKQPLIGASLSEAIKAGNQWIEKQNKEAVKR